MDSKSSGYSYPTLNPGFGAAQVMGILIALGLLFPLIGRCQVNTGSTGSDGALDLSATNGNIVIDMHDHPNGVYQYSYVYVPGNVTLTFIPNANNTPVCWLVQSNVTINGTVDVSGQSGGLTAGGQPGPGGYLGGAAGSIPISGQGPGGGMSAIGFFGGCASYGSLGVGSSSNQFGQTLSSGPIYGNVYLIPLLGGSGGGGGGMGGGGGGGALLIAASDTISATGYLKANGGRSGFDYNQFIESQGGGGSGGAIRLVASKITGSGQIQANGGGAYFGSGGQGRVRFDTYENDFANYVSAVFTQGSQFIITPTSGQVPQLLVTSVGGVQVSSSPNGVLSKPDAVLSAQQNNPIPIVVSCSNLPLNTQITVSVKPATGFAVSATGQNTTGTQASSTATISIVMPRGGGLIYATAATSN